MCFICRPPGQRTLSDDFVISFKQNLLVFLFKKRSDDRYPAHCEIKAYLPKSFLKRLIIARKGAVIILKRILKKPSFFSTVTVKSDEAMILPSSSTRVIVIVAVPSLIPVSSPSLGSTVTTLGSELLHL